jgi:hypothetical protein
MLDRLDYSEHFVKCENESESVNERSSRYVFTWGTKKVLFSV